MTTNRLHWINPVGGLGDTLMVSGVLKQVNDREPSRRYNLIRRTSYLSILQGHPAIAEIGFPPKDANIKDVAYWSMEEVGPGLQRPYQILARSFGLSTPVEEQLYLPGELSEDPILYNMIPWKKQNIIISPSSDSPRKMMSPMLWHRLVDYLRSDGILVMQAGRTRDRHIQNTYSLLGLTTPHQLISLLSNCELVITSDNFIMHAAHLTGRRAVVLWGPTKHEVYGYPRHVHLQMPKPCGLGEKEADCIAAGKNKGAKVYGAPCPFGNRHCMDQLNPEAIYEVVKKTLLKK